MTGAEFMANKWWHLGGSWFWGPSSMLFHLQPNFLTPRSMNQNTLSCLRSNWVPPVQQAAKLTDFSPRFPPPPRSKFQWIYPVSLKKHEKTQVGMQALAIDTFGAFLQFWSFLHFCQIIFELRLITVTRCGFSLSPFLGPIPFSQMV